MGLIGCICCAMPASAASIEELTPYFSIKYFAWEEHQNNRQILKETGPLFSAGILIGATTNSSFTLKGRAEMFGGEVDYDGETQAPASVPARTEVGYFGTKEQLDLGYRICSQVLKIEPFFGLGHRWWLRHLQSGIDASGEPFSGYTELWQTGYGRLGARGHYQVVTGGILFAEAGAMYPFYTGNTIDFAGSGKATFRPRGKVSGFVETGATWRQLKLTLYYEGFRWSASPVKAVGTKFLLQPESSSDILGLNLGWTFR